MGRKRCGGTSGCSILVGAKPYPIIRRRFPVALWLEQCHRLHAVQHLQPATHLTENNVLPVQVCYSLGSIGVSDTEHFQHVLSRFLQRIITEEQNTLPDQALSACFTADKGLSS